MTFLTDTESNVRNREQPSQFVIGAIQTELWQRWIQVTTSRAERYLAGRHFVYISVTTSVAYSVFPFLCASVFK